MRLFLFITLFIFSFIALAQEKEKQFQIGFYNVENLFDTIHDSYKDDYEFTPTGKRQWTSDKYWLKQHHIARVLLGMNQWQGVDVIGLCEVENKQVLLDLTMNTNLQGYNFIHHESNDLRGIDVAFLYKKKEFKPLLDTLIRINLGKENRPTRDILYVKGVASLDTLHFFVNHWSSRWGGKAESEEKRLLAALTLQKSIERLRDSLPSAKIIVMGDFNDTPNDKSIQKILTNNDSSCLANLATQNNEVLGTLKYQNQWFFFDQLLISNNLKSDVKYMTVYHPQWLQTEDIQYGGETLLRSFQGEEFIGGYSDHYPVYFYLRLK
jgi:predicted extracellular nuclease